MTQEEQHIAGERARRSRSSVEVRAAMVKDLRPRGMGSRRGGGLKGRGAARYRKGSLLDTLGRVSPIRERRLVAALFRFQRLAMARSNSSISEATATARCSPNSNTALRRSPPDGVRLMRVTSHTRRPSRAFAERGDEALERTQWIFGDDGGNDGTRGAWPGAPVGASVAWGSSRWEMGGSL